MKLIDNVLWKGKRAAVEDLGKVPRRKSKENLN